MSLCLNSEIKHLNAIRRSDTFFNIKSRYIPSMKEIQEAVDKAAPIELPMVVLAHIVGYLPTKTSIDFSEECKIALDWKKDGMHHMLANYPVVTGKIVISAECFMKRLKLIKDEKEDRNRWELDPEVPGDNYRWHVRLIHVPCDVKMMEFDYDIVLTAISEDAIMLKGMFYFFYFYSFYIFFNLNFISYFQTFFLLC